MRLTLSISMLLLQVFNSVAESVPARMISISPQVFPAVERDRTTRLDYRMSLSAFPQPARVNNELPFATDPGAEFTHEGFFLLEDPTIGDTIPIAFVLDLPFDDLDESGLPDFFDPAVAVQNVVTSGFHQDAFGGAAKFTATWNRAAGSASGTVRIQLPFLGRTFTHNTSLLAFQGAYDFTRAGTNLNGTVRLTNSVTPEDVLSGPFDTRVVSSNLLAFRSTTWQSPVSGSYPVVPVDSLERSRLSYVAVFVFDDGYPPTSEPDYPVYLFTLDSPDANGNGVPDLIEGAPAAERPALSIEKVPEGVRIRVQGTPGKSYALQSASDILATVWTREQSVSLGAKNSVTIIRPAVGATRFFRALEE